MEAPSGYQSLAGLLHVTEARMGETAHQHGLPQDRFEVRPNVALAVVVTIILGMIAATGWAIYAFNN